MINYIMLENVIAATLLHDIALGDEQKRTFFENYEHDYVRKNHHTLASDVLMNSKWFTDRYDVDNAEMICSIISGHRSSNKSLASLSDIQLMLNLCDTFSYLVNPSNKMFERAAISGYEKLKNAYSFDEITIELIHKTSIKRLLDIEEKFLYENGSVHALFNEAKEKISPSINANFTIKYSHPFDSINLLTCSVTRTSLLTYMDEQMLNCKFNNPKTSSSDEIHDKFRSILIDILKPVIGDKITNHAESGIINIMLHNLTYIMVKVYMSNDHVITSHGLDHVLDTLRFMVNTYDLRKIFAA